MGFASEASISSEASEEQRFVYGSSLKASPGAPPTSRSNKPVCIIASVVFVILGLAVLVAVFLVAGAATGIVFSVTTGDNISSSSSSSEVDTSICHVDEDCGDGHCVSRNACHLFGRDASYCIRDECGSKASCGAGEICMRTFVNQCIPAECTADVDCHVGHCHLYVAPDCSPFQTQMYCKSSADECAEDHECAHGLYCVAGVCTAAA